MILEPLAAALDRMLRLGVFSAPQAQASSHRRADTLTFRYADAEKMNVSMRYAA
jgi:hypothetical protein